MATASGTVRHEAPAISNRRRSHAWARVEDWLLTALSVLGAVCIIATIGAFVFHINLIMFKTGSMSPTIPAGSLAIVREIPASEIQIGDITTVSRGADLLPVTHRVISTTPIGSGAYSVEMKGDANSSPDMQPYEVTEAKKVLWHAPKLAYVVATASEPKYMAAITVAASVLVGWAFWPRKQK